METNIKDIRNLCEQNTENTEMVETEEVVNEVEETEEDTEETETETATKPQEQEKPKVEPLPEQKPFLYSPYERAILEEMERRATDNPALAEGLKDKDKSIGECVSFVMHRAQKLATDRCAFVEDNVVYAWAQFYYTQRREIISLEYQQKPTYAPTAPKAGKTDTKASSKAKKAEKKEDKPKTETKEQKAPSKDKETKVEGADGKTYTITELGLF